MIEFLLLRHAPTLWNAEKRIQGRTDVPLSPEGERLAATWRLPPEAAGWPVLASPLRRTLRTAEAMGLHPRPFAPLVEMDWGRIEGRRLPEIRAEGGAAFAANEALGLDFRPEGGETPREVGDRVAAALGTLAESTVCITHKGVLRALFARALGWDMCGKAPVPLREGTCHRFRRDSAGRLALVEANMPLVPSPEAADAEAAGRSKTGSP